ncbi:TPA: hypothetical protein R1703_001341 [Campylobacter lari]|nr:hypothetical protein [Campylobacter lari]
MKLLNFKLQTDIERLSPNMSTQHFKEYLRYILQDVSTSYFKRCDYIGLSLIEVQNKIDSISRDIQELREFKNNLIQAINIAKQIAAEIFIENGIKRMDGNVISLLTLTKESVSVKNEIKIKDKDALLALGYIKYELDIEAVERDLKSENNTKISNFAEFISTETVIPARVKINQRQKAKTKIADTLLPNEPFMLAV